MVAKSCFHCIKSVQYQMQYSDRHDIQRVVGIHCRRFQKRARPFTIYGSYCMTSPLLLMMRELTTTTSHHSWRFISSTIYLQANPTIDISFLKVKYYSDIYICIVIATRDSEWWGYTVGVPRNVHALLRYVEVIVRLLHHF